MIGIDVDEVHTALEGLHQTLLSHGIDTNHLQNTGHHLCHLSSTNGSGGVLDIYYPPWKLDIITHPILFYMTCQLWEAAYWSYSEHPERGENKEQEQDNEVKR